MLRDPGGGSFKTTLWGRAVTHYLVWVLEAVGIAPKAGSEDSEPRYSMPICLGTNEGSTLWLMT